MPFSEKPTEQVTASDTRAEQTSAPHLLRSVPEDDLERWRRFGRQFSLQTQRNAQDAPALVISIVKIGRGSDRAALSEVPLNLGAVGEDTHVFVDVAKLIKDPQMVGSHRNRISCVI